MIRPASMAIDPVGQAHDEGDVVLDHDEGQTEQLLDAHQQVAERLGLTLGDAGRGLVEQQHGGLEGDHARQLGDAPRARGQFGDGRIAERAQPHQLDERVGARLLVRAAGEAEHRREEARWARPARAPPG